MNTGREAAHLRDRARKCRHLAESIGSEDRSTILRNLADAYEAEAARCGRTDGLARPWLYNCDGKPV